jgi:hypothetical protein
MRLQAVSVRYFSGQAALKCAPHLIFSGLVSVSEKYHADGNEGLPHLAFVRRC